MKKKRQATKKKAVKSAKKTLKSPGELKSVKKKSRKPVSRRPAKKKPKQVSRKPVKKASGRITRKTSRLRCCPHCQDYRYCTDRGECCEFCDYYINGKCTYSKGRERIGTIEIINLELTDYRGDDYGIDDYEAYESFEAD